MYFKKRKAKNNISVNIFKFKQLSFNILVILLFLFLANQSAFIFSNQVFAQSDNRASSSSFSSSQLESTFSANQLLRKNDRGENVKKAQELLSQKGFYQGAIDGVYGHQTKLAVVKFQKVTGLETDGILGPATLKKLTAEGKNQLSQYTVQQGDSLWVLARRFNTTVNELKAINNLNSDRIRAGDKLKLPGENHSSFSANIVDMEWSRVDSLFPRESRAIITDVETGLSFEVKRLYGTNHADVEPLTAQDTRILRRIYGGSWSWDRRAVIVYVGNHLIAGSINGTPHGGAAIKNNNFPGHICLHFKNSRLHNNGTKDSEHQNMIESVVESDIYDF